MLRSVLCVSFALVALPAFAADQTAVGDWGGALHHGEAAWRVRLHVETVHDGGLIGTASGFPLEPSPSPAHVAVSGDRLSFSTSTGEYAGVWDQGRGAWVGTWKQADLSEPLALRWDSDDTARRRRSTQAPTVTDGAPRRSEPPSVIAPSR